MLAIFLHLCSPVKVQLEKNDMDQEEQKYTEVFNYLLKNVYPDEADKSQKRSICQMCGKYELKDGLLVLKGTSRRWIANDSEKRMILTACHDHPLGK